MQHFKFSMMVCACVLGLAVTAQAEDNAAQAAARAAVLAQMGQSEVAPVPPAAPVSKPLPPSVTIAPVVVPPTAPVIAVTNADNAAQAQARAALVQSGSVALPVAPVIAVQPVLTNTASNTAPLLVPVVPALNTKEGRLQALNEQYKAGQIAPLDYFNQREAILNGN